jgi:hypothetical protein
MDAKTRRKYSRYFEHVPILYAGYDSESYCEALMLNRCPDGMYFESESPIQPQCDLYIKIQKDLPRGSESEPYNAFRAKVKWCCQLAGGKMQCYGAGVQYTAKGHLKYGTNIRHSDYPCDYCDKRDSDRLIHRTESGLMLCTDCLHYIEKLPNNILNAVERFLKGNVV